MSTDLDNFLASMGLSGGGQRPPLRPIAGSKQVQAVAMMRERLKSAPGGYTMLGQFDKAFKLLEIASTYDIENAKIPFDYKKAMQDMLDYYVLMAADSYKDDNSGQKQAFIAGLKNLIGMAQMLAYALRAMEEDGRWEDLTSQP